MGCCCVGSTYLYVVAGFNDEYLNSIEQLNTISMEKGWRIITLSEPQPDFCPRQNCGTIPINDSQMLIFGGFNDTMLGDSYIFKQDVAKMVKIDSSLKQAEEFGTYSFDSFEKYVFCLANDVIHTFDISSQKWNVQSQDKNLLGITQ